MKTYLFESFNRYKRFSESLDVKAILCNKSWRIFNDSGEKEVYIFQEDGSLIISLNGRVTVASWQYIPANKSLIISSKEQSYMLHPTFKDNVIFALQVDGTEQYSFMIDESQCSSFQPKSFSELQLYFQKQEEEEQRKIEIEHQRLLQLEHAEKVQRESRNSDNVVKLDKTKKILERKRLWNLQRQEILEKDYQYNHLLSSKMKCQSILVLTLIVSIVSMYIIVLYGKHKELETPWWFLTINLPCFIISSTSFFFISMRYFQAIRPLLKNYEARMEEDFINDI